MMWKCYAVSAELVSCPSVCVGARRRRIRRQNAAIRWWVITDFTWSAFAALTRLGHVAVVQPSVGTVAQWTLLPNCHHCILPSWTYSVAEFLIFIPRIVMYFSRGNLFIWYIFVTELIILYPFLHKKSQLLIAVSMLFRTRRNGGYSD